MPPVAVPVFFTWTGVVNGVFDDYGHVVVWVPERNAFLSSPLAWKAGDSQQWVNTLEDFTSILGPSCAYLGWAEDLNGLLLVSQTAPTDEREDSMFAKVNLDSGDAYLWNLVSGVTVHIDQTPDYQQIDANFKTFKFSSQAEFENFRARFAPVFPLPAIDPAILTTAIASAMGGVNVDVNAIATAIATAIAGKLTTTPPAAPITKAGILSAIETNYTGA